LLSGLQPYAHLRSAAGGVYSRAPEFLAELDHKLKLDKLQTMESRNHRAGHIEDIKPLKMFHADPFYYGDFHRADLAWAIQAASYGLTLEQIKDELLNGQDLSKKGNFKRQVEYACRTAQKALERISK